MGAFCQFLPSLSLPDLRPTTHIEIIVGVHLHAKLVLDPFPDFRTPLRVKPAASLNFTDDPFLLGLLRQDPAQAGVVRSSPECKVQKEEGASERSRESDKDD